VNEAEIRPAPALAATAENLIACAMANGVNREIIRRLPALGLAECYLTAGCLFQALWNALSDRPPEAGVKDYDIFYFDPSDLSWEAEDAVIRRGAALFADLGRPVEIRNQARVHLWFAARFGEPCPCLSSSREAIDRFLISCTCIGIEAATGELYAPNGLEELWAGVLRSNPLNGQTTLFRKKAESYRRRWPWLRIVEAGESGGP
jgi:hypothetical protein